VLLNIRIGLGCVLLEVNHRWFMFVDAYGQQTAKAPFMPNM